MDAEGARRERAELQRAAAPAHRWARFRVDVITALIETQQRVVRLQRRLLAAIKNGVDESGTATLRTQITSLTREADTLREMQAEVDATLEQLERARRRPR